MRFSYRWLTTIRSESVVTIAGSSVPGSSGRHTRSVCGSRRGRRHHHRQQQANAPFPNIHSPTSYFSSGTTVPSPSSLAETIWLRVLRAISSSRIRLGKSDSSV